MLPKIIPIDFFLKHPKVKGKIIKQTRKVTMKKIYSIVIAVLVGLTFESGAAIESATETKRSRWCALMSARGCKTPAGLKKYIIMDVFIRELRN